MFNNAGGVVVKTADANVTYQEFYDLLQADFKPDGANARARQPIKLQGNAVDLFLKRGVSKANIAKSAAKFMLSKNAIGIATMLALPYVIDTVTGTLTKSVPASSVPPDTSGSTALGICRAFYPTYYGNNTYDQCKSIAASRGGTIQIKGYGTEGNQSYCWQKPGYTGCYGSLELPVEAPNVESCTSPSVYDTETNMCVGSAFNEPANQAQLQSDILDTLNNSPAQAPLVLDQVLANGVEPDSDPTQVQSISPNQITGEPETVEKNYSDPATGHPMKSVTTKTPVYDLQAKPGANGQPDSVEVTETVTEQTETTDEITNEVTDTTTTTTNKPATIETQPPVDECEKHPDRIGCSEYGEISEPETMPTIEIPMSLNPSPWGSGSCPSDVTIDNHFVSGLSFSYAPVCFYLSNLAPVLIAIGWLMAGWMVVGAIRD